MRLILSFTISTLLALAILSSYAQYKRIALLINKTESDIYSLYISSRFDGGELKLNERVAVQLPAALRNNLSHYTWYSGRELIKSVGAVEGDKYCMKEGGVFEVREKVVGFTQYYDRAGQKMPQLSEGCRTVSKGNFVAVSPAGRSTSVDSRYFGELPLSSITRRVKPLV